MPRRDEIVAAARVWLETPWMHQGRSSLGIDCAGLVIVVGNELGLLNYDTTSYQRRTQGRSFLDHFNANMRKKPIPEAMIGDVLLFRDAAFPCHSTIVADRQGARTIIHAHAQRRKVVEERIGQGDWLDRLVACFEFIGVEE